MHTTLSLQSMLPSMLPSIIIHSIDCYDRIGKHEHRERQVVGEPLGIFAIQNPSFLEVPCVPSVKLIVLSEPLATALSVDLCPKCRRA